MESQPFIEGMLEGATREYKSCEWYQFIRKAQLQGWINACKVILKR